MFLRAGSLQLAQLFHLVKGDFVKVLGKYLKEVEYQTSVSVSFLVKNSEGKENEKESWLNETGW